MPITLDPIGGGALVVDAPSDGTPYSRQDGGWVAGSSISNTKELVNDWANFTEGSQVAEVILQNVEDMNTTLDLTTSRRVVVNGGTTQGRIAVYEVDQDGTTAEIGGEVLSSAFDTYNSFCSYYPNVVRLDDHNFAMVRGTATDAPTHIVIYNVSDAGAISVLKSVALPSDISNNSDATFLCSWDSDEILVIGGKVATPSTAVIYKFIWNPATQEFYQKARLGELLSFTAAGFRGPSLSHTRRAEAKFLKYKESLLFVGDANSVDVPTSCQYSLIPIYNAGLGVPVSGTLFTVTDLVNERVGTNTQLALSDNESTLVVTVPTVNTSLINSTVSGDLRILACSITETSLSVEQNFLVNNRGGSQYYDASNSCAFHLENDKLFMVNEALGDVGNTWTVLAETFDVSTSGISRLKAVDELHDSWGFYTLFRSPNALVVGQLNGDEKIRKVYNVSPTAAVRKFTTISPLAAAVATGGSGRTLLETALLDTTSGNITSFQFTITQAMQAEYKEFEFEAVLPKADGLRLLNFAPFSDQAFTVRWCTKSYSSISAQVITQASGGSGVDIGTCDNAKTQRVFGRLNLISNGTANVYSISMNTTFQTQQISYKSYADMYNWATVPTDIVITVSPVAGLWTTSGAVVDPHQYYALYGVSR